MTLTCMQQQAAHHQQRPKNRRMKEPRAMLSMKTPSAARRTDYTDTYLCSALLAWHRDGAMASIMSSRNRDGMALARK